MARVLPPVMIGTALALSFILNPLRSVHSAPSLRASRIQVAYLYNFAKFVEWPATAFAAADAPFHLCVLGTNPFDTAVETLRNKTVKGRRLLFKQLQRSDPLDTCHLLFISASEREYMLHILISTGAFPVLTVSDVDHFIQLGGGIHLFTEANKIRFSINPEVTKRVNLKVSSKLLRLAKIVTLRE